MSNLTIALTPEQRQLYLQELLRLDGLSHIKEDPKAVYCPISLTSVANEVQPFLRKRQEQLMDYIEQSGLHPYNPGDKAAKYNPDSTLHALPQEVYNFDTEKILSARFFSGHIIYPSTGFGNENEKARIFNRVAVMFLDNKIRVSRMRPHRTLYLGYENFHDHKEDITKIFTLLQDYNPGMGFNNNIPVLLGFDKKTGDVVDLEELVYTKFPHLQYKYNGEVPILKLRAENPELFYEYEQN